jgi:hypothetical protein
MLLICLKMPVTVMANTIKAVKRSQGGAHMERGTILILSCARRIGGCTEWYFFVSESARMSLDRRLGVSRSNALTFLRHGRGRDKSQGTIQTLKRQCRVFDRFTSPTPSRLSLTRRRSADVPEPP